MILDPITFDPNNTAHKRTLEEQLETFSYIKGMSGINTIPIKLWPYSRMLKFIANRYFEVGNYLRKIANNTLHWDTKRYAKDSPEVVRLLSTPTIQEEWALMSLDDVLNSDSNPCIDYFDKPDEYWQERTAEEIFKELDALTNGLEDDGVIDAETCTQVLSFWNYTLKGHKIVQYPSQVAEALNKKYSAVLNRVLPLIGANRNPEHRPPGHRSPSTRLPEY